jgi:hypothetical protein
VPDANVLNPFPTVIWSAGDYWNTAPDANDLDQLYQYSGNLWMEGNDVGFDQADNNAFQDFMQADFNGDILGSETIPITFHANVFPNLAQADFNTFNASFPDAFTPLSGGFSMADWNNGKSAMVGHIGTVSRKIIQGFSLDSLSSPVDQNKVVAYAMKWLSLASNLPPSTPTSLSCSGSTCQGSYADSISLTCAGSIDPEGDPLEYHLEANLSSVGSDWWDSNWNYRTPVTLTMSGSQTSFRTSIDIDSSIVSDPLFWNNVNSDFGDIRFVHNGVLLEYYRMVYGSDFASFWIEFDAAAGENVIDLYWGNSTATYDGRTNPTDFFLTGPQHLVDDFDDNLLTNWIIRSGSWMETNGILLRTGGSFSEDQITKDWLQQGSSFYIRAQARPTSTCPNTEIALTRDIDHSGPTYLDEFFGMNVDNACPSYLYARLDLDHSPSTQNTLNSNPQVNEDNKTEVLISRTGWMGAFIADANASPFVKATDWEDANHWYPYLSVGNHGGGPSEADEIYTGNAPNHAYDIYITFDAVQGVSIPSWQEIGTHSPSASLLWNTIPLGPQSNVSLRCRAIDTAGSGQYSAYYQTDQNISLN